MYRISHPFGKWCTHPEVVLKESHLLLGLLAATCDEDGEKRGLNIFLQITIWTSAKVTDVMKKYRTFLYILTLHSERELRHRDHSKTEPKFECELTSQRPHVGRKLPARDLRRTQPITSKTEEEGGGGRKKGGGQGAAANNGFKKKKSMKRKQKSSRERTIKALGAPIF